MVSLPPLQLQAPPAAPDDAFGGLLGAATVLALPARGEAGIEFPPDSCLPGLVLPAPCIGGPDPADPTPVLLDPAADHMAKADQVTVLPFTVTHGTHCTAVGATYDEQRGRALRNLAQGEGRQVEAQLWAGGLTYAGSLGQADRPELLPAAATVVDAVAALEEYLGTNQGFAGMLHAGRRVAAYAARDNLILRDGRKLRTPTGNVWVFGGGYTPVEQAPVDYAGAGAAAWIYATSWITAYRGEPFLLPEDEGQAFDRLTNERTIYALRTYVLTWPCVTAAVPVTAL